MDPISSHRRSSNNKELMAHVAKEIKDL